MRQKLYSLGAVCALLLLASAAQAQTFTGMNLGGPATPGSFTDNGGGNWTITGGGGDIWGNSDQCYYYWAWASGSQWAATVKCTDLQGPDNWTKAEMMVRWSDPNVGPQANDGFIATMTTRAAGQNQIGPQYRPARGAGAGNAGTTATPTYPDVWLRLARTNNNFTIAWSSNNVDFIVLKTIDTTSTTDGFGSVWPDALTVGLAVTSHNNDPGQLGTAQFEGLTVTFPPITAPTVIGASVQVTDSSAYAGSEASFRFSTTNNSVPAVVLPTYQWYRNGTLIPNATGQTYTYLVNPSDATENGAKYYCQATVPPPYNATVTGLTSATGTVSVLPGAVYYTNGLKQELFRGAGIGRVAVENGNVGRATSLGLTPTLDSAGGLGNDYVSRQSGWFIPSATANYNFFLACDDDTDLFIGTNDDPATKRLVAQQVGWSPTRSWLDTGAPAPNTQGRSDMWSPDQGVTVPYMAGIPLTAGTRYYIEVVHHQGGGGDNRGVTYQTTAQIQDPNWTINFTNGAPSLMTTGLVLITTPTTTLTWSQPPTNTSVSQGASATFYAQAATDSEMAPSYQWYRNGSPIAGATGTSWSTGGTTPADNGASITVSAATVFGGFSITSSPAILTVISAVPEPGWTKVEYWNSANRAGIENGTAGNPTYVYAAPAFEANVNNVNRSGNGRRLSGYFIPPATDDYVFFVNADDDSDLFLSTDNTTANKRLIAQETAWSNPRQWTAVGSGSAATKRSDQWLGTNATPPYASGIHLIAGQQYYIEQVQANGSGGDNAQVTYKRVTDPDPALGSASSITGTAITSFAPRCNWVNFTTQPTNPPAVSSSASGTVSFYAAGTTDSQISIGTVNDGSPAGWPYVTFQWQKNGVDIPGAINGTYTLYSPFLPSDNGAVFTCKLRALGYADNSLNRTWSNSLPATLTVITNTPNLLYSAYYTNNSWIQLSGLSYTIVTLAFDSPMDPVLLSQASTYTLGGGLTITSVTVSSNDYRSVSLQVAGTPTFPLNVTIDSNVHGLGGGPKVANTTLSVNQAPLICGDVVLAAGTDPAVPGTMVMNGAGAYTIAAEGSDIWNNGDGFNFCYEMKTGDFDVVVRQIDITHSSHWAKGGLMVRETLDNWSRNWHIVNTPLASDGIMAPDGSGYGATTVDCNARISASLATAGWGNGTGATPAYPNAWVRLKRTGDGLTAYSSTNGLNWLLRATNNPTVVGDMLPLPATVFVGICVTAHNNDVVNPITGLLPTPLIYLNTSRFADYNSSFVPSTPPASLTATKSGANIVISWAPAGGHLESTLDLATPDWQPVPGGTANPTTVPITIPGGQYFRVVNQ